MGAAKKFLEVVKIFFLCLLLAVPIVLVFLAKNFLAGYRKIKIKARDIKVNHEKSEVKKNEYIPADYLENLYKRLTGLAIGRR